MKEFSLIIQAFDRAVQQQQAAVLATVVHIEGSAYRAPGARMLVVEDGSVTGAVSGGCLEGDVLRKALLVMQEDQPALVTYDTRDDRDAAAIGVSLGCNGVIRILLEPVRPGRPDNPVELLRQATAQRQRVVLATFFTPADKKNTGQGTLFLADNEGPRTPVERLPVAPDRLMPDIRQAMAGHSSSFIRYAGPTEWQVFLEYIQPGPALVIAGAGNDVLPLVAMADLLGWDVHLLDGRPAYASSARFPGCQLYIGSPEQALQQVTLDSQTAILLLSHNYAYDLAMLRQVAGAPVPYIGILGPRKKTDRLLAELAAEGLYTTPGSRAAIYGPTGIDINAETPAEIALSILSEAKAVLVGKAVPSLRENNGRPIHQRPTQVADALETYAVLVLAAGQSKRMGRSKQALLFRGDTFLRNTVRTALALGAGKVVVVAGAETNDIREQLKGMDATVLTNEQYAEGMGSSIRAGVTMIERDFPHIHHIFITVCDQPFLDTAHLRRLLLQQRATGAVATASFYAGRKGVPALFGRPAFAALAALGGDKGAKHLLETLGDAVATVAFPAGAVDVDDQAAYEALTGEGIQIHES